MPAAGGGSGGSLPERPPPGAPRAPHGGVAVLRRSSLQQSQSQHFNVSAYANSEYGQLRTQIDLLLLVVLEAPRDVRGREAGGTGSLGSGDGGKERGRCRWEWEGGLAWRRARSLAPAGGLGGERAGEAVVAALVSWPSHLRAADEVAC